MMVFVPMAYLRSGMVVARDTYIDSADFSNLPLLRQGYVLNQDSIRKLSRYPNLGGIYIESKFGDDIEASDTINRELKVQVMKDIKTTVQSFNASKCEISPSSVVAVSKMLNSIVEEMLSNPELALNVTELKSYDNNTYSHSLSVAVLTISTGMSLGLSQEDLNSIGMGAVLHDIGKTALPKEIINKQGKLTDEEFNLVKKHPKIGYIIANKTKCVPSMASIGILQHHEKYDGSGYVDGVKGKRISLTGRIIALADVFDAVTSDRPYKKADTPSEAVELIMGNANRHFDGDIIPAFLRHLSAYPVGSCVRLSNGSLALIVKNSPGNVLRPTVRVINDDGKPVQDVDLFSDRDYMNVTITKLEFDEKMFK